VNVVFCSKFKCSREFLLENSIAKFQLRVFVILLSHASVDVAWFLFCLCVGLRHGDVRAPGRDDPHGGHPGSVPHRSVLDSTVFRDNRGDRVVWTDLFSFCGINELLTV